MSDELKDVARIGAQPVHPIPRADSPLGGPYLLGMTLRQYAATAAMQGLLAADCPLSVAALEAVEIADALLKELNRE